MSKSLKSDFLIVICLICGLVLNGHAKENLSETFDTLWEMQWHQSGYPMNARKLAFENTGKIIYSISPAASKASNGYVQEAVAQVAQESGVGFVQAIEHHAGVHIEFVVKRFDDEELRRSICYMRPTEQNFRIVKTQVVVSEQHAYRCVLHELMHAMGFMGHPMGETVLTYFGAKYKTLSTLDKFVLRAWYGDASPIVPGMNIFRVVKLLNERWITEAVPAAEQAQAIESEKQWFAKTVAQMDAFADGKGEPPRILYRSGRLNETGLAHSRNVIHGILGTAYMEGFGVEKNTARAYVLLFRGAKALQLGAINALERGLVQDRFVGVDVRPACEWYRDRLIQNNRLDLVKQNQARMSKSCGDAFVAP